MRRLLLLVLTAFVLAGGVTVRADSLPENAQAQLQLFWENRNPDDLADLAGTDLLSAYFFDRIIEENMVGRISIAALRRDLQLGSFSTTSGSTSIVARPGLTDIASAAMESGAVSRTTDGNSMTLSVNALPIYQLMSGRMPSGCGSLGDDCRSGPGRWVRGLSGSFSINTDAAAALAPGAAPISAPGAFGLLTGGPRLMALSARYEFLVREREATAVQQLLDQAAGQLSEKVSDFLNSQAEFETELDALLAPSQWRAQTIAALQGAQSLEEMSNILLARYRVAYDIASASVDLQALQADAIQEKLNYIAVQNRLLAEMLYRKALTIDYVSERPSDQPQLHQIRLVAATPLGSKPGAARLAGDAAAAIPVVNLTLNAGVSFYGNVRDGAAPGRLRDGHASLALDWSPDGWGAIRPTYTAAYYFQYMIENAVIQFNGEAITPGGAAIPLPASASEVLNTTGPIHVGQIRLNIPIGNSGASFPLAVSYSNRTELITGRPFWRGQAGLTYDFSRLRDLLSPGNTR